MREAARVWGKNFHGRNKANDDESDTDDDEDELQQAELLQKVKAEKMKRYMESMATKPQQSSDEERSEEDAKPSKLQDSDDSESSSDENEEPVRRYPTPKEDNETAVDAESFLPLLRELKLTIGKLRKLDGENTGSNKHLKKLNTLRRGLLRSYKTYLSFAVFEHWHRAVDKTSKSSFAATNVMQKLSNIRALYQKLCADQEEWGQSEETQATLEKKADQLTPDELYQTELNKLRERKAARKEQAKQIKEQREEEVKQMDQDIQRNAKKEIIQNKGLKRHRKKIDRNPRVKKRMKFEKMNTKWKSVTKQKKEGPEQLYAGEAGLRQGLIASTKIN